MRITKIPLFAEFLLFSGGGDNSFEGFGLMFSETGENFSVEGDVFLFQSIDKFAVRKVGDSGASVDLNIPELSEIILLVAPMSESMRAGMKNRFLSLPFLLAATETVAFDLL